MSTKMKSDVLDTFDEYDAQGTAPALKILEGAVAAKSYFDLKQELVVSDHKTLSDIAAATIQNQWRIYKVHQRFRKFLFAWRKIRLKRERPIFNLLLLNSFVGGEKRKKYYEETNEHKISWRDLYIHVKKSSFELFTATNLMFIPITEDDRTLLQFTRQCGKHLLSKVFNEWRIINKKNRKLRTITRYDTLAIHKFGCLYTTFEVWYKYTLLKKKQYTTAEFPQWNNIIRKKKIRQQTYENAVHLFDKTIKRRTITALANKMAARRIQEDVVKDADHFRERQIMKTGSAAWAKFMNQKKAKQRLIRTCIFNWWVLSQSKKHNKMLFSIFQERSSYLKKRTSLNAFMKNVKIEKAIEINGTMKITNNMSLSLWLAFTLMKKPDNAAISLAFHGWKRFCRGRRFWIHFIFSEIRATQYDPLKRRAFEILKKSKNKTIPNQNFSSKPFQVESVQLYETVMTKTDNRGEFYLLSYDNEIQKELEQTKTPLQQINVFTKLWQKTKSDGILFRRCVLLYKAKQEMKNITETIPERTKRLYMASMNNLSLMGYMSEEKWRQVIKLMNENSKRMFRNRQKSLHNDNMIMLSFDAHGEAIQYEKKSTFFKTLQKPYKIQSQPLPMEDILPLSSIKPAENVPEFVVVQGVRSVPTSFKAQLKAIRKQIANDMLKMSTDKSDKKHLKILAQSTAQEQRRRSTNTNIHNESFNPNDKSEEVAIRPSTGINDKLRGVFPPIYKKGTANLNVQLVKFSNDFDYEDAKRDDDDDENIPLNALEMSQAAREMLSEARFMQSMTFGSSFANFLSSSGKISSFSSSNTLPTFEDENTTERSQESIIEETNEEMSETESQRTARTTGRKSILKEDKEEHGEEEDFTTMKTLSELDDPEDHMKSKRYTDFLNILFGKSITINASSKLTNLRKRIKDEIMSRRANAAAGLDIVGNSFGISGVLEEYRAQDAEKNKHKSREKKRQKSREESPKKGEKEDDEFQVKYNSRKFKHKKDKNFWSDSSDYDDDENEDENNDMREDLIDEKASIESALSDVSGRVDDIDIDAAEEDKSSEVESNESDDEYEEYEYEYDYEYEEVEEEGVKKRVKVKKNKRKIKIDKHSKKSSKTKSKVSGEQSLDSSLDEIDGAALSHTEKSSEKSGTTHRRVRKKKLKDVALKEVNKIVFKMLESHIVDAFLSDEDPLVEIDPDYVPELELPEKKVEEKPHQETNIKKPVVQKPPRQFFKTNPINRKPARIVIPDRREFDQSVYNAFLESEKFATVTYNNGTNKITKRPTTTIVETRKPMHPFNPIYRMSAAFQNRNLHFEDEKQVVSFGGGDKRHIQTNNTGFMQVRINNSKRKTVTKPVSASPQPRIPDVRASSSQQQSRKPTKDESLATLERKTMTFIQTLSSYTSETEFKRFVKNVKILPKSLKPVIDQNIGVQFDAVMTSYTGTKAMDQSALEMFKTIDQALILSEFMQRLVILITTKKSSPQDCARAAIKLFKTQPQHINILVKCTNTEESDRQQGVERMRRMRNNNNSDNPAWVKRKAVTFADVGWVRQFEYRFVSLQFGDDNSAIIAPVDQMIETRGTGDPPSSRPPSILNKPPSKEERESKTRQNVKEILQKFSECQNDSEMESVLGNFDLDELISVARYIASEEEMDSLLSK